MAATPDVRPVGDLPDEIGKTAARELSLQGVTSLRQAAEHSKSELLGHAAHDDHGRQADRQGPGELAHGRRPTAELRDDRAPYLDR